jgi:hypothetical protein
MKMIVVTATILTALITQASAACTLWPGKNDATWRLCMQVEQQQQEIQRMRSQQQQQQIQLQQQQRR